MYNTTGDIKYGSGWKIYICYAQSTDSDHPRILLHKPRIRALHNNPRIAYENLRSADFAAQTSDLHAIF